MLRALAALPLSLFHGLGVILGWTVWMLSPRFRRLTRENLAAAGYESGELLRQSVAETGKGALEIIPVWFRSQDDVAALLEVDEDFLIGRFALWETIIVPETGRRWLLIYAFQVPLGYSGTRRVTLALEVPPSYPAAQIDMFYVFPRLRLTTGVGLPNTEVIETIMGQPFQRWSRHRGQGAAWKAEIDNVITHLALVESSLRKEVAQ